jgi:hypothetical protein
MARGAPLRGTSCVASIAALFFATTAEAAPLKGSLHVTRESGAEACLDESQLRAQIEAALGRPVLAEGKDADVVVEVRIRPVGKGFVGDVSAKGKRQGERSLEDPGPTCEVLAGALAITIAILLEGDDDVAPAPVAVPWYKQYYLLPAIESATVEEPPDDGVPPLAGSIGALYDAGRLDGETGGLYLGVDVLVPYVTLGLAFVSLPEDRADLPTTTARLHYFGGRFRVCSRQPFYEQFGASFCGLLAAGERRAALLEPEARLPFDEQSGGYAAIGLQVDVSRRVYGPVGLFAEFGLEFPVVADELSLDAPDGSELLVEHETGVFDMGIGLRFWLEKPKEE